MTYCPDIDPKACRTNLRPNTGCYDLSAMFLALFILNLPVTLFNQ
jgi:hypothetical protein